MENKLIGPVTFHMEVHFTNTDGSLNGSSKCDLAAGRLPTEKAVMELIGETLRLAGAGEDLRLMNPDEFFNRVIIKAATGRVGKFAVPNDFTYDTDAVAKMADIALQAKPKRGSSAKLFSEAHVWVVELRSSKGEWRPSVAYSRAYTTRKDARNIIPKDTTCKYRIRKYVRPPPCGSEGK